MEFINLGKKLEKETYTKIDKNHKNFSHFSSINHLDLSLADRIHNNLVCSTKQLNIGTFSFVCLIVLL